MQCKLNFQTLEVKSRIMEAGMCLCVSCIVSKHYDKKNSCYHCKAALKNLYCIKRYIIKGDLTSY